MSFSLLEKATMFSEYDANHNTGMDITAISEEIFSFTSGYPFLVSKICQHIDEKMDEDWTVYSVCKAVKMLLNEKVSLLTFAVWI